MGTFLILGRAWFFDYKRWRGEGERASLQELEFGSTPSRRLFRLIEIGTADERENSQIKD
jgi:hypothetical protein